MSQVSSVGRGAPAGPGRSVPSGPIAVLLVDDHELLREGLTDLLAESSAVELVGAADSIEAALAALPTVTGRPGVVLLDPELAGWEAVAEQAERSGVGVVVLDYGREDSGRFGSLSEVEAQPPRPEVAMPEAGSAYPRLAIDSDAREIVQIVIRAARVEDKRDRSEAGRAAASADASQRLTELQRRLLPLFADGLTAAEAAAVCEIPPRQAERERRLIQRRLGVYGPSALQRAASLV